LLRSISSPFRCLDVFFSLFVSSDALVLCPPLPPPASSRRSNFFLFSTKFNAKSVVVFRDTLLLLVVVVVFSSSRDDDGDERAKAFDMVRVAFGFVIKNVQCVCVCVL